MASILNLAPEPVTTYPYLPELLQDVVSRVNDVFSSREEDPFNVYFSYGLQSEVTRKIYKEETTEAETYPLVWLLFETALRGDERKTNLEGIANANLIIAMPTQSTYTPEERTELIFKPRLIPIYKELLKQISLSSSFSEPYLGRLKPEELVTKHYWGGTDAEGADTKNLFNNYIDALLLRNLKLEIQKTF